MSHVNVERNCLNEQLGPGPKLQGGGSGEPVTGVEVTGGAMAWE